MVRPPIGNGFRFSFLEPRVEGQRTGARWLVSWSFGSAICDPVAIQVLRRRIAKGNLSGTFERQLNPASALDVKGELKRTLIAHGTWLYPS